MPKWLLQYLPMSCRIYHDYEGAKLEILKALRGLRIGISVPEIAEASRFGIDQAGPLYGHVHRLVREGFVEEKAEPRNIVNDRPRGGRQRYTYMLSPEGVHELHRLLSQ